MLINREVIQAKVESTYGTDAVPVAGTDDVLIENVSWSNEGLRMNARPAVRQSLGELRHVYGGSLRTVSFDVEIKGSGTIDSPPELGVLLRGCAMGETITASTSVVYTPVSTGHESLTIYYYQDGMLYKLTGCRGTFSVALEAGALGKMSFTFTGHWAQPTDTALITPTYDSTVPVPFINSGFQVGSYAAVINALSLDLSNTVATPPDSGASDGYAAIQITKREPSGSYDPEAVLVATDDPTADFLAGTTLAITTGTIGSTAGNRYNLTLPACSYRDTAPGDRDGIRTLEIPFGCAESSGDDDVNFTFT